MNISDRQLQEIENIYLETKLFLGGFKNNFLTKPNALNGKLGFCILYTPPISDAEIMVIGQQPSSFGLFDEIMMDGNIPNINSYTEHEYPFAKKLTDIFDNQSDKPSLLKNCIGLNIWFYQKKNNYNLSRVEEKQIKDFCQNKTKEIIKILKPKTIFVVGIEVFNRLIVGREVKQKIHTIKNIKKNKKNQTYFAEGLLWNEIPIFGCPQFTAEGYYKKGGGFHEGVSMCLENINYILRN